MKTLIVTGGTGGLGTVVVERLAVEYRCVLLVRKEGEAPANADTRRADLSDEASVRAAFSTIDAPYGLVHLAGGFAPGKVSETTTETWNRMIGLNLTGGFVAIREALARMRRDAPGRIVAVSSIASLANHPGSAAYNISKSALNRLIELTAAELRGSGITANAVLPDSLDTPATRASMPSERLVPLDRVAETIAFLLSDAAASVNGALIPLPA